jgi:hypothetical protein
MGGKKTAFQLLIKVKHAVVSIKIPQWKPRLRVDDVSSYESRFGGIPSGKRIAIV